MFFQIFLFFGLIFITKLVISQQNFKNYCNNHFKCNPSGSERIANDKWFLCAIDEDRICNYIFKLFPTDKRITTQSQAVFSNGTFFHFANESFSRIKNNDPFAINEIKSVKGLRNVSIVIIQYDDYTGEVFFPEEDDINYRKNLNSTINLIWLFQTPKEGCIFFFTGRDFTGDSYILCEGNYYLDKSIGLYFGSYILGEGASFQLWDRADFSPTNTIEDYIGFSKIKEDFISKTIKNSERNLQYFQYTQKVSTLNCYKSKNENTCETFRYSDDTVFNGGFWNSLISPEFITICQGNSLNKCVDSNFNPY